MGPSKKKIYILFMIITIMICIILVYKLQTNSKQFQRMKTENAKLIKENENIKSNERIHEPSDHVIPNDSSELIVKNEKGALLAFLYYLSLMNFSDKNEMTQIDITNYNVKYSQTGSVIFLNSEKDREIIIQESDNHEYYQLTVKSINALKDGGSGTGGRYYIYKDGYVVSAY